MMKAVLLAAGKGTRLRPLTDNVPKVMIPVKGKPILEYHLEHLLKAKIREIYINLHHFPEKIKGYFENGKKWGVNLQYSYESRILGTAGAVKNLEKELKPGPFLVVYGDNFLEIDYKDFIKFSESRDGIGSVAVFEKEDVGASGILEIGEKNRVKRFTEKPKAEEVFSHWVSAGVYFFRKEIFAFIPQGFSDFGFNVLPKALKNGAKLYAYKLKEKVWAIDSLELLHKLLEQKSSHKNGLNHLTNTAKIKDQRGIAE